MADEEKNNSGASKKVATNNVESLIGVLFLVFIASHVLSSLTTSIGEKVEDFGEFEGLREPYPITANTDIGEDVFTIDSTQVWSEAGRGTLLGSQPEGMDGILVDGPERFEGVWWWSVDFVEYPDGWVREHNLLIPASIPFLDSFLTWFVVVSMGISLFFLTGIIYAQIRLRQIRSGESREIDEARAVTRDGALPHHQNERWNRVEEHLNSDDESNWRLAILEADILLDEMITAMGYAGDNLGEKLKVIEESDFTSLNDVWEAHKIRNQIAHEGSSFSLSHREAKRVIGLYEKAFKEFRFI